MTVKSGPNSFLHMLHYFLIFQEYFVSMRIFGLRTDEDEASFTERYYCDPEQRRLQLTRVGTGQTPPPGHGLLQKTSS